MIKLIVALGNPGVEYELTRHNIGWLAVDGLSFFDSLIWKSKFKGEYSDRNMDGEKRYFLKPQTYMNLSGESAQALMTFFKIKPSEILVVHDELDLPYGTVMFKQGGGLAGHNGLKSLAKCLGTQDFNRLRLGIGRPTRGDVAGYVLSKFSQDEFDFLDPYLKESAVAIELALEKGFSKAAQQYSKKKII